MLNWQKRPSIKIISVILAQAFLLTSVAYTEPPRKSPYKQNSNNSIKISYIKDISSIYISGLLARTTCEPDQRLRVPMGSSNKRMSEAMSILSSQKGGMNEAVFTNMEHKLDEEGSENYVNIKGPSFRPDVFQFTMKFIEPNISRFVDEHSISKFDIRNMRSFLKELWHNSQIRGIGNFSYETYLYKPKDSDKGAYLHISILQDGINEEEDWKNIKTLEQGFKDKGADYLTNTDKDSQRKREKTFSTFGSGFSSIGYMMKRTDVRIEYKMLDDKRLRIDAWIKLDPFVNEYGSKKAYYSLKDFVHEWGYNTLLDIKVEPQGTEFLQDLRQRGGFENIALTSTDSYQKLAESENKYDVITISEGDFIKIDRKDFFNAMKKLLNDNGAIIIRTDVFFDDSREDLKEFIRRFLETKTDFEIADDIKINMDEFLTENPLVIRKKEVKNDRPRSPDTNLTPVSEKALKDHVIILKGDEYSFKKVIKISSLGEEERQKFSKALLKMAQSSTSQKIRLINYASMILKGFEGIDIYAAVEDTIDGWNILALQVLDVSRQDPVLLGWIKSNKEIANQLAILAFTINDLLNRGVETVDSSELPNALRIRETLPSGINDVSQMKSFLEEYARSLRTALESASNNNASAASVLQKLENASTEIQQAASEERNIPAEELGMLVEGKVNPEDWQRRLEAHKGSGKPNIQSIQSQADELINFMGDNNIEISDAIEQIRYYLKEYFSKADHWNADVNNNSPQVADFFKSKSISDKSDQAQILHWALADLSRDASISSEGLTGDIPGVREMNLFPEKIVNSSRIDLDQTLHSVKATESQI